MSKLITVLSGLGIIGGVTAVILCIMMVVTSFIGIYLAFSASIIVGVIFLIPIVAPANFVFGLCWWFGMNIPEMIQAWAGFPI
ncbi:MAG: hypothetical protein KAR06_00465 [Deltaproteobacteria bacterium]|nr:hypothetical protein [Deltaproteobacteria bacterium]